MLCCVLGSRIARQDEGREAESIEGSKRNEWSSSSSSSGSSLSLSLSLSPLLPFSPSAYVIYRPQVCSLNPDPDCPAFASCSDAWHPWLPCSGLLLPRLRISLPAGKGIRSPGLRLLGPCGQVQLTSPARQPLCAG